MVEIYIFPSSVSPLIAKDGPAISHCYSTRVTSPSPFFRLFFFYIYIPPRAHTIADGNFPLVKFFPAFFFPALLDSKIIYCERRGRERERERNSACKMMDYTAKAKCFSFFFFYEQHPRLLYALECFPCFYEMFQLIMRQPIFIRKRILSLSLFSFFQYFLKTRIENSRSFFYFAYCAL